MSPNKRDFPEFDADAFVGGVLGRTTGGACGRAVEQLADLMDDQLQGLDRQLVQAHLEHCTGCRQLAVTMGWLHPLLPQMVEIDPGPEFLAGVLARTSLAAQPIVHSEHPLGLAGLMDRFGRWWEKQIVRPEFSLQAAYVATVVVVLLTATPWSPLREVPGQALTVVTAGPESMPIVGPAVTRTGQWLDTRTAEAVDAGHDRAGNTWQDFEAGLDRRSERSASSRDELKFHWETLKDQAEARDLGGMGYELLAALSSWNVVWDQWWHEAKMTNEP